jgi:uncharacterized protein (TIGR00730 family)
VNPVITTDPKWEPKDFQVRPNGYGLNQPAVSALVPKSEEWFALEVAMHHPDFPRADYRHVLRLFREFAHGFAALSAIPASVVLWGSARSKPEDPFYRAAVEASRLLAQAGFGVITGGGPGIMEAANKGAREAGGMSIGLPMESLTGEPPNRYQDLSLVFSSFVARKIMFLTHAQALVIFPGGFGTLDELFEALVLVQTRKVQAFPIILYGKAFWSGLLTWMRDTLATSAKTIDLRDPGLLCLSDHPQEVASIVEEASRANIAREKPLSLICGKDEKREVSVMHPHSITSGESRGEEGESIKRTTSRTKKAGHAFVGVGVGAIIFNAHGEVFLAKRGRDASNEQGWWAWPGGEVEFGETLSKAIQRELREEFDMVIEPIRQIAAFDHLLEGGQEHWVSVAFVARHLSGEPRIKEPGKCSDFGWFSLDHLPARLTVLSKEHLLAYRRIFGGRSLGNLLYAGSSG